jgi:hypothetical protein
VQPLVAFGRCGYECRELWLVKRRRHTSMVVNGVCRHERSWCTVQGALCTVRVRVHRCTGAGSPVLVQRCKVHGAPLHAARVHGCASAQAGRLRVSAGARSRCFVERSFCSARLSI